MPQKSFKAMVVTEVGEDRFVRQIEDSGLAAHVTFLGPKPNPRDWFRAGDVFLLPSREDPFPLVCLEAAEAGMPVVCFAEAGGMPDFVEDDAGFVVPYLDVEAMAEAVDPELYRNRAEELTSKASSG